MTRKAKDRLIKIFAIVAIIGMILSLLAGGLLVFLS